MKTLMFEVVNLVVGYSPLEKENSFRCNVLFSALLVFAIVSALCQFTSNNKICSFKDTKKIQTFDFFQLMTRQWDLKKHTAVTCLFGNGCESD